MIIPNFKHILLGRYWKSTPSDGVALWLISASEIKPAHERRALRLVHLLGEECVGLFFVFFLFCLFLPVFFFKLCILRCPREAIVRKVW